MNEVLRTRRTPLRKTLSLGTVLALALHGAGYRVGEIVARDLPASRRRARGLARRVNARATTMRKPELTSDLVWFCVPDRAIGEQARVLAKVIPNWKGRVAMHSSGALDHSELDALRRIGARTASAHPLMTFVPGVQPSLKGVGFAVEGDDAAVRMVRAVIKKLGAEAFPIERRHKAAYHAWGTFASPLLIALLALTERVAQASGVEPAAVRRRMLPILRQTLENYGAHGAARAFSGALIRGDAATVRKHQRVVKRVRGAEDAYRALAGAALQYLPVKNRKDLEKALRTSP
jgi:predicted short-subunit dehydrogenase-like oxidoreductase (DUF2520 family)